MITSLTDNSRIAKQIRHFIPLNSENPRFHTRFYFTEPAYVRAFMHTNPRILLCILQTTLSPRTRFSLSRPAYTRAFAKANLRIHL